MSANVTIYCLEQVTDYAEFERLCVDLMSLVGYSKIEPLGGFKDKGRDAVHVSVTSQSTIFAYSVREDWRAKLSEDAEKVHRHGHKCDKLVFVTTAKISAGERDEAISSIREQYGWELELYAVERLRNLLDVQFPHLKANHPQVFPPEFLAIQSQMTRTEQRDHILINFAPEDEALADWLARKLISEGYLVWCEHLRAMGSEPIPEDIDDAIQRRALHVVALYSEASLRNPDLIRQRAIALGLAKQIPNFLIALRTEEIASDKLDQSTLRLTFLPFATNWAEGLGLLLARLGEIGCPKLLPNGKAVAAGLYLGKNAKSEGPETIVANMLEVHTLPDRILRFAPAQAITGEKQHALISQWAFRAVSDKLFLSFHFPPQSLMNDCDLRFVGRGGWKGEERVEGINTKNLVSELIRKALLVKCGQKGLVYCQVTGLYYFPFGLVPGDKLRYRWPNGRTNFINTVGERKYSRGKGDEYYRYYLAPEFYISQNLQDEFTVLIRTRVRITDVNGIPLPFRKGNSRRKDLCKGWWNSEWLSRMLAICQFLADGSNVVIGAEKAEQIAISAEPVCLLAPTGIDETALGSESYEREDILLGREEDTDDSEVEDPA